MEVMTTQSICDEISRQEGFDPSKCVIRVTQRDNTGNPIKLILLTPKKQMTFSSFPIIMFGNVKGNIWKKS